MGKRRERALEQGLRLVVEEYHGRVLCSTEEERARLPFRMKEIALTTLSRNGKKKGAGGGQRGESYAERVAAKVLGR